MRITTVMLLACVPALAQLPQAAWEGEVDGRVEITIRGDRMDTREISGPSVGGLRYRVYDPLPMRQGQIRLQMQQGRGSVRIAQQPSGNNNYTAVVTIDDSQSGRAMYAFQLFWDLDSGSTASNNNQSPSGNRRYTIVDDRYPPQQQQQQQRSSGAAPSQQIGGGYGNNSSSGAAGEQSLRWTGTVDDEVIIECRQRNCAPLIQRGADVVRDRVEFTRPLPVRDAQVNLTDPQGRGEIRLVEPPTQRNNYTTRVKIRDTQGGAGDYAFTLRWIPPVEIERQYSGQALRWSGRVDGKVRVVVRGSQTSIETLAGSPVTDERAIFDRSLPNLEGLNPTVAKRRGRGRVELVEFPSRRNGYRLVFTVDDDKGGADNYEVEVGW